VTKLLQPDIASSSCINAYVSFDAEERTHFTDANGAVFRSMIVRSFGR
jgi:hypothetical protein